MQFNISISVKVFFPPAPHRTPMQISHNIFQSLYIKVKHVILIYRIRVNTPASSNIQLKIVHTVQRVSRTDASSSTDSRITLF